MSMILPLLIWYWCFGKSLKNQITAVIDRSNTLTEYYRMYDRGMHRSVSESTLHRELDNLLELLLHLFINKMTKIYVLYTVKWILIIIICSVWVAFRPIIIKHANVQMIRRERNAMFMYHTALRNVEVGIAHDAEMVALHRELDNLLELLLHLFINKMTKIYVLYTVKWILIIIICSVWVVGQVFLLYPDLIIFQDSFHCVLKDTKGATISASCAIPTSTFLRAVWYINIAFLSLLIICTFACLIFFVLNNSQDIRNLLSCSGCRTGKCLSIIVSLPGVEPSGTPYFLYIFLYQCSRGNG
jgi:hypothetical protein